MCATTKNNNILILFQLCVFVSTSTISLVYSNTVNAAEKQKYTAVVPRHFPPHYVNNSDTQVSGFAIDVMNKVAELANIKIEYSVKATWSDVDKALLEGEADLIPNLGITPGRRARFNFSLPVETYPVSIFVRSETEYIRGLSDLPEHSTAVVQYNIGEKILKAYPDIRLKRFQKAQEALFELLSGNVDALAYPMPVVTEMAKAIGVEDHIKIVGKPLTEIKRAMAVRKDHTVLLNLLNNTLQEFLGSKEFRDIYLKWHAKPTPYWTTQRAVWLMGIVLAFAMISMFGWRYVSILRINKQLLEETNVRKTAERTIREREAHISLLMNSIAEAIYGVDINGNCTFANPACVNMLGYSSAIQLLGKNMSQLIYHNDSPIGSKTLSKIQRVYQEGRGIHVEHEYVWRADGSYVPVECWAYPIKQAQNVVGAVISFIDITERLQAQQDLYNSEQRYRATFNQASVGIAHIGIDGKILRANSKAVSLFGYSSQETTQIRMQDLLYESDLPNYDSELDSLLRGKKDNYTIEKRFKRKGGDITWVNQTVTLLKNADGSPLYYIMICQDINDRKQVEQELLKYRDHLQDLVTERTHKLQVANEELETFSYSVSHDLRAPLRSIDGFSMALYEDYYSKLDDSAKDHIKRIRASTKHMGQLIDDMLSLSKVSRHELRQEEVDLSGLASEVMCQLIDNEPTRDINITIKDTPGVMGDATLLQAVLENLCSNTWKFTKNTNNPSVEFGCLQKDGEDVYYVRDNGIGFDMAYSNKLFGTFNRLHKQEDYEGTGIGLATVKRIINRHGGKVWAESEVGKGATFYFTLATVKHKPKYKHNEKVLI